MRWVALPMLTTGCLSVGGNVPPLVPDHPQAEPVDALRKLGVDIEVDEESPHCPVTGVWLQEKRKAARPSLCYPLFEPGD